MIVANMKNKVLNLYKPIGPTSLQLIKEFRKLNPKHKNITLGYAGRLDPMAEGVLLVLVGEENKKREKYLNLNKVYEFEVLFGFATDTYDILGKITAFKPDGLKNQTRRVGWEEALTKALKGFEGKIMQKFPPYSSYTIKGKTLFTWAREKRLHEIEIPSKERQIFDIKLLRVYEINRSDLLKLITEKINKVKGPFRQKEILHEWSRAIRQIPDKRNSPRLSQRDTTRWNESLKNSKDTNETNYTIASCYVLCSSGTYVRSIANDLGKKLGIPSLALSIKRTKVENYNIKDSVKL